VLSLHQAGFLLPSSSGLFSAAAAALQAGPATAPWAWSCPSGNRRARGRTKATPHECVTACITDILLTPPPPSPCAVPCSGGGRAVPAPGWLPPSLLFRALQCCGCCAASGPRNGSMASVSSQRNGPARGRMRATWHGGHQQVCALCMARDVWAPRREPCCWWCCRCWSKHGRKEASGHSGVCQGVCASWLAGQVLGQGKVMQRLLAQN